MKVLKFNLELNECVIWMQEKDNLVKVLIFYGLIRKVLSRIGVKIVS